MTARLNQGDAASARSGRGTLLIVASMLFLSAAIRLAEGADHALAQSPETGPPALSVAPPGAASQSAEPGAMELLAALQARERKVVEHEAEMARQAEAISEAKTAAEARIAELAAQEAELSRTVTIAEDAAEGDVMRLVAVYEAMKPKDAVPLFEVMDPEFAAGFLARMKPEAAAAVLAGLEPSRAYTVSAVLAGRNARAPRD